MQCPVCGTNAPSDALFCPKCGERQKTAAAAMTSPAADPTPADMLRAKVAEKAGQASPSDPEVPLWKGGYSPKAMIGGWLLALLVTLVAIAVAVFMPIPVAWFVAAIVSVALWGGYAFWFIYQRLSVDYELSTQRLIHRRGVFNRVTNRVEVIDVDDVQVTQSFVERFFGVGTIRILSSDLSDPKVVMVGIDDVQRIAKLIDDTRRAERRKHGLYVESV